MGHTPLCSRGKPSGGGENTRGGPTPGAAPRPRGSLARRRGGRLSSAEHVLGGMGICTSLINDFLSTLQVAVGVVVEGYERRIAALEAEVAQLKGEIGELKEQLGRNSQNSARPPTLEGPGVNRKPPREPAGRQRGAQLGQPGQPRVWLPVEQVSEVSVGKPTPWRRGGGALPGGDPQPQRHQGIEVPPPAPQVSDYQLHRLPWARCGIRPCGTGLRGCPRSATGRAGRAWGPWAAAPTGGASGGWSASVLMSWASLRP